MHLCLKIRDEADDGTKGANRGRESFEDSSVVAMSVLLKL